jgi:hypothetical protein
MDCATPEELISAVDARTAAAVADRINVLMIEPLSV